MTMLKSIASGARLALIGFAGTMTISVAHGEKPKHPSSQPPAIDVYLDVVRERAPGLPGFTVYRPADLRGLKAKFPVIAWSNGACSASNQGYMYFLMQLAARGFVVVAYGSPEIESAPNAVAAEDRLKQAIDWATSPPRVGGSPYHNRLDANRVAAMGHSCGGIDAVWTATHDARVKAVVSLNSGCFPDDSDGGRSGPLAVCRQHLGQLRGPAMFVAGGASDVAYPNSIGSFEHIKNAPAVFASHATVGHSGFFNSAPRNVQAQLVRAVVEFLDGTLNGKAERLAFLIEPTSELGKLPDWSVKSKGF